MGLYETLSSLACEIVVGAAFLIFWEINFALKIAYLILATINNFIIYLFIFFYFLYIFVVCIPMLNCIKYPNRCDFWWTIKDFVLFPTIEN